MKMLIGTSQFTKTAGDFPEFPVVNMFAEDAPSEDKVSLVSRPGLEQVGTELGVGPIRAIFQQEGVLSGDRFVISGSALYRNNVFLGLIDGDDAVSITGFETFLFIAAGKNLWGFDGTMLQQVVFPDNAYVSKICIGASRLIALRKGTQKFYWSDVLDSTIDALSFASAENRTDYLLDAVFVGDVAVLFGSSTVELWPVNDSNDVPFLPLRGRTFSVGVKNTGAACEIDSTFAWVTDTNQVCISSPENVISFSGLEEELKKNISVSLWSFLLDGTTCLALRTSEKTWIFHGRSQLWSQFASTGYNNWVASCASFTEFGSSVNGKIYKWSDKFSDFSNELERRFRAWSKISSGGVIVNDITLRTNPGHTSYTTTSFATPSIEMRLSKDGGQTWGSWRKRKLGSVGKYRIWTKWNSNGMFGYPGILCEFRVTDPVPFRVSDVFVNEERGGV